MLTKQIFRILDMHCTSCAMSIDGELENTDGIRESTTNFAKGTTEISFENEKIDALKIIETIKKAGYLAEVKQS